MKTCTMDICLVIIGLWMLCPLLHMTVAETKPTEKEESGKHSSAATTTTKTEVVTEDTSVLLTTLSTNKPQLGEECLRINCSIIVGAVCNRTTSKCTCGKDYYQYGDICKEIQSLRNIHIETTNVTTANITIYFRNVTGNIDYYSVTLKLGRLTINTTKVYNTREEVTFHDLYGDTTYTLEIVSYTGSVNSEPMKTNITTGVTHPGPVNDTTVTNQTNFGFYITWSPPEHPNGKIEEYIIKAFVGNVCHFNKTIKCEDIDESKEKEDMSTLLTIGKNKCSKTMQYLISELIPSQMFTVTVAAKNKAGFGDNTNITANTTSGGNIMDAQTFRMKNLTERTISFAWQTPELRFPFTSLNYTVKWTLFNASGFNSTNASEIIISNLEPGQMYTFELIVRLFDGENRFVYDHKPLLNERTIPCHPTLYNGSVLIPPNINIRLISAEGKVDCYIVTLRNETVFYNKTVANDTLQVTFDGLDGGTRYTLTMITHTGTLYSKPLTQEITTEIIVPGQPKDTNVSVLSATSMNVTWVPPSPKPGPTDYKILVYEEKHINSTTYVHKSSILISGYFNNNHIVSGLLSYWNYMFNVIANTSAGSSECLHNISIQTKQSAPGMVQKLRVLNISGIYTKVNVTWMCPVEKERNGLIKGYLLRYTFTLNQQKRADVVTSTGKHITLKSADTCKSSHFMVTPITPEIYYTFFVTAFTLLEGNKSDVTIYTKPGKPPSLNKIVLVRLSSEPKQHGPNETRFIVDFCESCLTNIANGMIIFVGMLICKTGTVCIVPEDHHNISNWYLWKKNNYKGVYQPTPANWLADKEGSRIGRSIKGTNSAPNVRNYASFEVGNGKECNKKTTEYCNGPLDSGSQYSVKFISCTHAGCTQSEFQEGFVTKDPESSIVGVVVGSLVGIVLAGIIIVGVWYYKRRYRKQNGTESDDDSEEVDLIRPIKMSEFHRRLEELRKDSNLLFSQEFTQIQSNSPKKSCETASFEPNRLKNRYVNILAFDHSRVKLMPIEGNDNSEYINANYIPGYTSAREYIATQGPQESTVNDLWQMVWEQKVSIIVMLTGVFEGMKQKCHKYWPEELQVQIQCGDLTLMLDSISTLNTYTLKIFKLRLGATERTVKHFFMHDWRDYDATDVVNFISDVRRERRPSEPGPMVVHCSAGRTGTFIAIDYFIQFINNNDLQSNIDIFQFVLKMREHRPHMVQAEKQYIFIHETVDMLIEQKMTEEDDSDAAESNEQIYQNAAFVEDDSIYVNLQNGKECS